MTALFEAKELYSRHGLDFERDLGLFLANGLVISLPDRFVMAKQIVALDGPDSWNPKEPDCWYIHCAVGRGCLEWFLLQSPVRLPLLAWRRFKDKRQSFRVYNTSQIERFT